MADWSPAKGFGLIVWRSALQSDKYHKNLFL